MKLPKGFKTIQYDPYRYQIQTINFGIMKGSAGLLLGLGLGKCVHPDTYVSTDKGPIKIKELWEKNGVINKISSTEDTKVLNDNLYIKSLEDNKIIYSPLDAIYKQKINEDIIKLHLSNGEYRTVTKAHKFKIFDGTNIIWKNNPDINDYLLVPKNNILRVDNNKISTQFAEILGWQIAEGHEGVTKYNNFVTITQKDINVLLRIQELYIKEFGVEYTPKITKLSHKSSFLTIKDKKYLEYLNSINYKFGNKSGEKEIPEIIFTQSEDVKKYLLRALFDGESSITKNGTFEFTSKSNKLINQIQFLLSEFGIYSFIKEKESCATNTINKTKRIYYLLHIPTKYFKQYKDKIGFIYKYKENKLVNVLNNKKRNSNIGVPTQNILNQFKEKTNISGKIFEINSLSWCGKQGLSEISLNLLINNLEKLINNNFIHNTKSNKNYKHKILQENVNRNKKEIINLYLKLKELSNYNFIKINKKEIIKYNGFVYDLQIKNTHNFLTGNYIAHNTFCAINIARYHMHYNKVKKVLILCPSTIMWKWQDEIHKCSEFEAIVLYHQNKEKRMQLFLQKRKEPTFYIANYEALEPYFSGFYDLNFDMIIADETSRFIQTATSGRTLASIYLADKSKYRLILTGTLIAKKPLNIWSQFRFLDLGESFGPDFYSFRGHYFDRDEHYGNYIFNTKYVKEFGQKIYRRCIKYTKDDVSIDLPEILPEEVYKIKMGGVESTYDKIKNEVIAEIETELGNKKIKQVNILTKLIRLQQVTSGFIKDIHGKVIKLKETPKLDSLINEIESILEEEESCIVWCRFIPSTKIIGDALSQKKIKHIIMTGEDNAKTKDEKWKKFQKSENINVFIGQIEAGGIGIELFKLDSAKDKTQHTIFYEKTWVHDHMVQAAGRSHRIGQKSKVRCIHLLMENSIDEKIHSNQMDEKELANKIMRDGIRLFLS